MIDRANKGRLLPEYKAYKSRYSDCVLMYQVGEFFEILYEDAVMASRILGITLTKRGDVPMCGIPKYAIERHAIKLTQSLKKVAVCAQVGTNDGVIRRDITRIFTPGSLLEDDCLCDSELRYVASVAPNQDGTYSIAWADISIGSFFYDTVINIKQKLGSINPIELLLTETMQLPRAQRCCITNVVPMCHQNASSVLQQISADISAMGKSEVIACGILVKYLQDVYRPSDSSEPLKIALAQPSKSSENNTVIIDVHSKRNLEIFESHDQAFYNFMSKFMQTACGRRLLHQTINAPLKSVEELNKRLDAVEFFFNNNKARKSIKMLVKAIPDFEKAAIRIATKRGRPMDLFYIHAGVSVGMQVSRALHQASGGMYINTISEDSGCCHDIYDILKEAVVEYIDKENPQFIKSSFSPILHEMRSVIQQSQESIGQIERKLRRLYSIDTLKISSNNKLGHYIEVPTEESHKMIAKDIIHRQPLLHAYGIPTAY